MRRWSSPRRPRPTGRSRSPGRRIYICMGLALAMILNARGVAVRGLAIALFAAQFALQSGLDAAVLRRASGRSGRWSTSSLMLVLAIATTFVFGRDPQGCGVADGAVSGLDQLRRRADLADRPAQSRCRKPCAARRRAPRSRSESSSGYRRCRAENRIFDDFAKVLNGAAGTLAGMGREAEASRTVARARMDRRARFRQPRRVRGGEGDGGRRARRGRCAARPARRAGSRGQARARRRSPASLTFFHSFLHSRLASRAARADTH